MSGPIQAMSELERLADGKIRRVANALVAGLIRKTEDPASRNEKCENLDNEDIG